MRVVLELSAVGLFALTSASHAATYTYSYTGNPETGSVLGPLAQGEILTVSFTLDSLLSANLDAQTISTPTDFVIKDGPITLTPQSAAGTFLQFWTNSSGAITMWNADAFQGTSGQSNFISMGTFNNPSHVTDLITLGTGAGTGNINNPGTWSVSVNTTASPVPEPTSFVLLATAIGGLARKLRHRSVV